MKNLAYIFVSLVLLFSCKPTTNKKETKYIKPAPRITVPQLNPDSAYNFVKQQVDFGPRVPNTRAHEKCADYLVKKLKSYNAEVIVQKATVKSFDNKSLNIKNIIGQYNPANKNRIILTSHWDSRPFSDHSEHPELRDNPILGANDGASGVGILLEIARLFKQNPPTIGVDIIFFDAEDYGSPDHKDLPYKPDAWCLGSQYWSKNKHRKNYSAKYGILLDMVGAPNAIFTREGFSMNYAPWLVDKVWGAGTKLGYSNFFDYTQTGSITDDHYYLNTIAQIPSIDIIQYDPTTETHFGAYWHTENDNMSNIDKYTLKAVGQTLLYIVYNEK
ncbi:MAG: M28 family peptidase [Chlorobi bacterium]|nr:M28 family peptidase [Chlorobiota bacterium]